MTTANEEVIDETAEDDSAGEAGDSDRGSDRSDSSSDTSDRGSKGKNAFAAVRAKMGDTLRKGAGDEDDDDESDPIEEDEDDVDQASETEGDEDASDAEDESDQEADEDSEARSEKKGKGQADDDEEEDDGDESAPRYEIVDDKGERYDVELPKGATIRFTGDGKKVEIGKFADLVALAQKGTAFDRVSSTAGQVRSQLEKRIGMMLEERKADEDLLIRLAFDELSDEEKEKLQTALESYRDPKAREGLRKLADEEERTKAESLQSEQTRKEAAVQFWTGVDQAIGSEIKGFEYLDSEDATEIKTRFYQVYTARLDQLLPEYQQAAPSHGLSKEQATQIAQRDAAKVLNEKTLRKVMKQLDEKYAARAGRGRDDVAERRGKREAEQHNKRVEAKRDQRRDPRHRSLRSGGAPIANREISREKAKPVGFENRITASLRKMRRTLRESEAD